MRIFPLLALGLTLATPLFAAEHEVMMLNRNATGGMVYEPDFLRIAPGDTVVFRATHPSHNAASIAGMLPEGASRFIGKINEEIAVTLTAEGSYGVKCSPHYSMGMVMLIQVGEGLPDVSDLPPDLPPPAASRFADILSRAAAATP